MSILLSLLVVSVEEVFLAGVGKTGGPFKVILASVKVIRSANGSKSILLTFDLVAELEEEEEEEEEKIFEGEPEEKEEEEEEEEDSIDLVRGVERGLVLEGEEDETEEVGKKEGSVREAKTEEEEEEEEEEAEGRDVDAAGRCAVHTSQHSQSCLFTKVQILHCHPY